MKSIISICFLCCSYILSAQQNHFLYLQTENKQPFYAKLDKKVYSSQGSGYIIIPKLQDGSHSFLIGFPKNELPEQSFNYTIHKDAGFIIKNFGEKGWGLFNLQSMDIIMPGQELESKKQPVKNDEISPTKENNQIANNKKDTIQLVNPTKPQVTEIPQVGSIKKISQTQSSKGIHMIFIDDSNEPIDTIQVFIPLEEKQSVQQQQDTGANNKKFLNIELPNPNIADNIKIDSSAIVKNNSASNTSENKSLSSNEPIPPRRINPDCKELANEKDFLKLRKKMAAESNDEDMLSVAAKSFRNKCYTTEQVKNLSVLFMEERGKYKFYSAVYPYVFDLHNFYLLQNQLHDEYYINRFKDMIHN